MIEDIRPENIEPGNIEPGNIELDETSTDEFETSSVDEAAYAAADEEDQDDEVAEEAAVASKGFAKGVFSEDEGYKTAKAPAAEGAKKPARKRWYIVHTYSGHENKVKINLERRIESMNMQDKIFRVEVPQKAVTKIKDGRRTEREERIFPGYVLVEMIMDDDSWYVVRHTPGVTKFVGSQKKPIPARDSEIKRILFRTAPVAAKIEIDLKVGEVVKIISGPFADFEGTVTEVSPEKERLKATVSIFGRETPVELAFNQIQKA